MNTVWKSQETKINLFCKFQEQKSPATFHHASVFKCCLHRFVFNLGQLSTVRGFLGFAFQCFLLKCFFLFFWKHLFSLLVNKDFTFIHFLTWRNSTYGSPLSHLHTPYLKMSSSLFFFLNCLNLRVLIATGHLLFRELSPNCSHTHRITKVLFF